MLINHLINTLTLRHLKEKVCLDKSDWFYYRAN